MNRWDLLEAMNSVEEEQLEETGRFYNNAAAKSGLRSPARLVRTLLLAAAITVLLGATAYAAGFLGLRGRETEPEETFPVHFVFADGETVAGKWTGTYALEFDAPETCPPVRYRFGWLPEGLEVPEENLDGEWIRRWDWTGDPAMVPWGARLELGERETDLFFVSDVYYAPQFVNDGALILMSMMPTETEQETWGELSVLKIRSESWRRWTGEEETWEDGLARNFIVLFHPEQGWIFAIRGTFPLEDLEEIARNVVVEQTEGLVEPSQFQNPYDFFDASQG